MKYESHHADMFSEHLVFLHLSPTNQQASKQASEQTNKQTNKAMIIDDQLFGLRFDDI